MYPTALGVQSGIYRLLLSCEFDTGDTTEAQNGDVLVFAIDNIAPLAQIVELGENFSDKSSIWKNTNHF